MSYPYLSNLLQDFTALCKLIVVGQGDTSSIVSSAEPGFSPLDPSGLYAAYSRGSIGLCCIRYVCIGISALLLLMIVVITVCAPAAAAVQLQWLR